tara:strand:- start:4208 stop:4507 length:300 start_codon:yes stop_codon:yes gene_type:complete
MKLTKEQLKKIIEEELEDQRFGQEKTSRGAASRQLHQRSKDIHSQKGVDDKERGIISQIEDLLTKLADTTDIKTGSLNSTLKKLYTLLQRELGEEFDEK